MLRLTCFWVKVDTREEHSDQAFRCLQDRSSFACVIANLIRPLSALRRADICNIVHALSFATSRFFILVPMPALPSSRRGIFCRSSLTAVKEAVTKCLTYYSKDNANRATGGNHQCVIVNPHLVKRTYQLHMICCHLIPVKAASAIPTCARRVPN